MTPQTTLSNTPVRPEIQWPSQPLPESARAVIVGGGVVGASVAYHLAKMGWKDVLLLEQNEIGAGTTWHAAGMVGQLRTSNSLTKINKYSVELYPTLEQETGIPTGWLQVGSLIVGTSEERMIQLRRTAAMAEVFGVEATMISADEAGEKWPLMRTDDVLGAVWLPHDGRVIPGNVAVALAKGAADNGAMIHTGVAVEELIMDGNGRATGVRTSAGEIKSEWVILCGGMWARELGLKADIDIPLFPVEHHYILSEPIEGASKNFACMRDPDGLLYARTLDDNSIMLGAFQKVSQPWMAQPVPRDFSFGLLEPDWEKYKQPLASGKHRIPALETAEFPKFINGPESFTPDNNFIMGKPAQTEGVFVLAGFNSVGIASAGGVGKYAAEWLEGGESPMDLWSVDIRRFLPIHNDRAYLTERTGEVLGLHYQMAWPNREFTTARGLRRTPLYDRLTAQNACFGQSMGWERANWFAPEDASPEAEYSFNRQNWAPYVAEEVRNCRENVSVIDQSTFSKYLLRGEGACGILQQLCANNVDVPVGKVVYTGMLNERGTYESDLTVVRTDPHEFYIVTSTTQTVRDADWIRQHIPFNSDTRLIDVTSGIGVVSVMGPNAPAVLSLVTDTDLSESAFPPGTAQEITIDGHYTKALRISYVGENGWELHTPFQTTLAVYDSIIDAGNAFKIGHAGVYAINAMRLEKGFRAWGHDISPDDTPLEAGLSFAVDWNKDFLGKASLLKQKEQGIRRRLVSLVLKDPNVQFWGNEPVFRDGKLTGYTTSAAFGPTLGSAVAMAYVKNGDGSPIVIPELRKSRYEIACHGQRHEATLHLRAPHKER
ncbi:MAG: FAD-dependent oxidoreductase [Verrucomicrobiae bacterium]|nr:FAD-dependent oxidoreductase [Verrucomicrobiae bacterium]